MTRAGNHASIIHHPLSPTCPSLLLLPPESWPLLFPSPLLTAGGTRKRSSSRRCGVSVANWPATKPHIHSATFNQKSLSRPDPGQGRAATDSDTCQLTLHGNTRPPILVATVHTVPSSSPAQTHSLAAHNGTFWPPPMTMDRGPWLMGHGTMCRCHPTTRAHPCASPSLPFPTRSQVESTASHDHLNVSIRPEFRAEEEAVEHWYRAYWKTKRLPA